MSAARILRDRQASADQALDTAGSGTGPDCSAALAVQTTTLSSYPTSAASFFAANPLQINGPEIEGGTAAPVVDTTTVVYVLNLGTQVPPNGTPIVAHAAGGKWVTRYDG